MRYLPLTEADRRDMLAAIGVPSIDALFADVPPAARHPGLLDLPRAMGELEVERRLGAMAAKNLERRRRRRSFSAAAPTAITCRPRSTI